MRRWASAACGSDYRRAARRMRQLAWRTHLTAADISPPSVPDIYPHYCRHLPLRQIFNIFRRKNVLINIFLNEKTFMYGFKFFRGLLIYLFVNIFLDKFLNIFLDEKTFMCGFKFLEAIPKHFLRRLCMVLNFYTLTYLL